MHRVCSSLPFLPPIHDSGILRQRIERAEEEGKHEGNGKNKVEFERRQEGCSWFLGDHWVGLNPDCKTKLFQCTFKNTQAQDQLNQKEERDFMVFKLTDDSNTQSSLGTTGVDKTPKRKPGGPFFS